MINSTVCPSINPNLNLIFSSNSTQALARTSTQTPARTRSPHTARPIFTGHVYLLSVLVATPVGNLHSTECTNDYLDNHDAELCDRMNPDRTAATSLSSIENPPRIGINYHNKSLLITEYDSLPSADRLADPIFVRHFNSALSALDLGLGAGWLSNFHSRIIFINETQLDLLTPTGLIVHFYKNGRTFESTGLRHGTIEQHGQFLIWNARDGGSTKFKGSLPVKINQGDQQSFTLHYQENRLVKITNTKNRSINFTYQPNGKHINKVVLPDKTEIHYSYRENILTTVNRSVSNTDTRSDPLSSPSLLVKDGNIAATSKEYRVREYRVKNINNQEKALIISVTVFPEKSPPHSFFDAKYNELNQLSELNNHNTGESTRLEENKIQNHPYQSQNPKNTKVSSSAQTRSSDCITCSTSVEIMLDEYSNATGIRRGNFKASWQMPNGLAATSFTIQKPENTRANSATGSKNIVKITERDNLGRPVTLASNRFGSVNLEYKNTHRNNLPKELSNSGKLSRSVNATGGYQLSTVKNSINTVSVQNKDNIELPALYQLSDLNPESMAVEAATIVRLDNIAIGYANQQCLIQTVTVPEASDIEEAVTALPIETDEFTESQCDDQASGMPANTTPLTTFDFNAVQLDIRPQNCSSFFDINSPIARGSAIEQAIAQHENYTNALHTAHWFPVVDFVIGRTAVVQISRDLSVASYASGSNSQALYNRLLQEGAMINQRFLQPLQENGSVSASDSQQTTTITENQIDDVRFELIIQQGTISLDQLRQIELAGQTLMSLYNIHLSIVTIP